MSRNVFVKGIVSALLLCAIVGRALAQEGDAWRFRLGPFLEFSRDEAGVETRALRPLYSSVCDSVNETAVRDVVWPAATFYRRGTHSTGRVLIAGWSRGAEDESDDRYSQWLFPIYLGGRTREGETYQALFPLYGKVPEFFLMQDVRFVVFPFYFRYHTARTERRYTPWPLVCRAARDDGDLRYSFFPFYGSVKTDDAVASYAFWPFWTQRVSTREGHRGTSTMLFPIYARTRTESERSWMALPPFIFHGAVSNRTGITTRTRAPWPFFVWEEGPGYTQESYWPIYGSRERQTGPASQRASYALWPLANWERHQRPGVLFSSDHLVPFYFSEERIVTKRDGGEAMRERYTRVWPLWSYETLNDQFRLRVLELWPMRHGGGIERNWAPFWTWFVRCGQGPSMRDTDILWGLARWGETRDGTRYGQVTAVLTWRRRAEHAAREWRLFGLRVAGAGETAVAEVEEP